MKKIMLALCAALASGAASADTILGFDVSVGAWKPSYSGDSLDHLSLDEDNIAFVQAALEHPIPMLPNIMLTHSSIETSNTVYGNTVYGLVPVDIDIDLSHTDATFYYEILDNWVNLDLGLTARKYTAEYNFTANGFSLAGLDQSDTRGMLYGMARFDLPFTGWSVVAQGNATDYSDTAITDLTTKVRWDFAPALDLAVEAGYRVLDMELQDSVDQATDIEIKGPYLGLNLHL